MEQKLKKSTEEKEFGVLRPSDIFDGYTFCKYLIFIRTNKILVNLRLLIFFSFRFQNVFIFYLSLQISLFLIF